MTDLHTHILPGMDDGAKNAEMSLEMLRMELEQGVDNVVLTPHCYRDRERPERFLERRKACYDVLMEAVQEKNAQIPNLYLGAEVAWVPNLADWPELPELCIQGTTNMLVELPFHPWSDHMIHQLYDLIGKRGITPIFAHLERYMKMQKEEHIQEIISLGTPIQISCEPLLHFGSRRPLVKMIRHRNAHLLATDCHNLTTRPPNMGPGMRAVARALGHEQADRLIRHADGLIGL